MLKIASGTFWVHENRRVAWMLPQQCSCSLDGRNLAQPCATLFFGETCSR
jgi:hypothetical protein